MNLRPHKPNNNNNNNKAANRPSPSGSITDLLAALCDCSLTGVSWKRRALGSVSREGVRRALKKRAYGALLSKLFQDGTSKGFAPAANATATTNNNSTPARNKVLMISFDLRVAGCQEDAERLEDLLGMLPEAPTASGLKEMDAVLELLVHLAGSSPLPPTSFSRDYMRRERQVLRRPPLGSYISEDLQRLEAQAWGLVCGEEWRLLGGACGTLGLMDAPPGTGLLAMRTRTEGHVQEERFQKETRTSLFGALQHSRTSDLDVRLDLPPVPSNADVTGLVIRVPPSLDQSEDEGFLSASNLTPDSVPSPTPEADVWEALRTFEPRRRRCWESVGGPPGKRELPYLTEGGREAFDQLYRLWEGEMRVVSATPSPLIPLPLDSQTQLVTDLLNVLIGVASTTFPLNQCVQFDVRPGVCVSGASPESVSRLLGELAQYGTHYLRLSRFALQSANKKGLVFQAFTGGLRKYLHYYRACVLSTPPTLTLITIGFLFRKVGRQLRYLSELCCVDGPSGVGQATFPVGVKMLSYLYNEAQSNCSNENYPVLLSLLKSSCEPYTRFVYDWVYSGVFRDVYSEFMIQVNEDYLSIRDKHFWVQGYTLISKDVEDCVPVFLRHIANDVYVCGKTINLLKICCPQHYICGSELPVPRIAVTFSLQEVEEIERDCAMYRGRMERIAKHSAISREEQALRTEQARQELINQVRESAAKTLESIRGRQVSQRLVVEARKKERFEEMKENLEQEQEWRNVAQRKQEEDDFSFARELKDREKRLQSLEEQLEERARKELIARYSRLSEEAARRERRALWRVQRMRLDEARAQFIMQDNLQIGAILEKYPLGQERPPAEALPPASSAQLQNTPQESPMQESSARQLKEQLPPAPTASPALISEDANIKDVLPNFPEGPNSEQVDQALQEIGSDLPDASCKPPPPVDYDFSAPFCPLEGIGGDVPAQPRPHWGPPVEPDVSSLHPSFSHIPIGENVSETQETLPRASPYGHASQSSFPLGRYTPDMAAVAPKASLHGHPSQATVDARNTVTDGKREAIASSSEGEAGGRVAVTRTAEHIVESHQDEVQSVVVFTEGEECPPRPPAAAGPLPTPQQQGGPAGDHQTLTAPPGSVLREPSVADTRARPSGAHIQIGEHVSEISAPLSSQNIYGHASDAHLKVGQPVSAMEGPDPPPSVHGHASDAHIKVGNFVSEVAAPLLSPSVYGHASDAHIKVGNFVSEVAAPLLSPSIHGHTSDAHIKVGDFVSEVAAPLLSPSVHGHASDAHIKVGDFVSEVAAPLLSPSIHGHTSDAHIKVGDFVSEVAAPLLSPSVHGHASDAHIKVGDFVSEVAAPLLSPSVHGHASDAHIKVGEHVSEVNAPLRSPGIHGHASDSHIKIGENISGFVASVPSPNIHGHASDAHIRVGEHVSEVTGHLPTPNIHGHASDAHIRVGEHVSEVTLHLPTPNVHGHSSDANIKVGGFVSNVPEAIPRWNKHGHASDCTLQVGCLVSGIQPVSSPLPGSAYGHSSDSALRTGCMVSGTQPLPSAQLGSAYGHSSDSTLDGGCVVSGVQPQLLHLPGTHGHSSDSSLGGGCQVMAKESGAREQKPDDNTPNNQGGESDPVEQQQQQQLAEGMLGSWAASWVLSPAQRSEQEYVLSLAAHYQVEQYEDGYNLSSSPDCQLLKQVTRGPWGLPPVDPTLHGATDTTTIQLSEMVSLPVLMKHSVTTPLITHVSLVNKAVVDYFFVELGMERHFEALRHFLLMEDGEFAQSLSDLLFEKLASGQTPGELLTPLVLNNILSKALQYSLHGDIAQAANFTFALRFLPETFHPHAPDSLNCLELRYKVDWPLNIIITDSCMNKYNRLFSFLLQLKHMVWSLRDVWFHLKRTALVKGAGRSVQYRQLQLYRHEMQHFVKVIQGYIANQILQVSWSEFTAKLASASDLDAIHRMHADYLNRAIFRGLLTEKAAPVMNIIHSIFSLILKFRAQLIALPWDRQQGEAVHPSFIAMQQSYNTFKYYSHFLFKVVTKLVNRGYQPHLEDFLLRINFNNYYKDS